MRYQNGVRTWGATGAPEAAVASAAYRVMSALAPSQATLLDAAYAASLSAVPDGPAKDDGIAVGVLAADHILMLREYDGSSAAPPPYMPGTGPGQWRSTPPAFAPAVF